jgi:hypothetical protein
MCAGWDHIFKITAKLVRTAIVSRFTSAQKRLLEERQRQYRGVRGSRASKKWLTIWSSEKIKDVEDWVLLRSWYEFDGLLSQEAEFLWMMFWLCCMIPRYVPRSTHHGHTKIHFFFFKGWVVTMKKGCCNLLH